jgi:hypothetical protein
LSLPKTTYFISEEALLLLLSWLEREYAQKIPVIEQLRSILQNPKREQLITKVTKKLILQKMENNKEQQNTLTERQKLKVLSSSALQIPILLNGILLLEEYSFDSLTKKKCLLIVKQLQKQLQICKVKKNKTA